jgi:hypothetical protein
MAIYLCRWPNGDCSFVSAPSRSRAIEELDKIVGNAEGCPIREVAEFQIHLTDDGRLALDNESGEVRWSWNAVQCEPLLTWCIQSCATFCTRSRNTVETRRGLQNSGSASAAPCRRKGNERDLFEARGRLTAGR